MYLIYIVLAMLMGNSDLQGDRYESMRQRMVKEQIVARGITDRRTLEAMRKVPRHLFVPEQIRNDAYDDSPLPIGHGQTISQPYIVALMTEISEPEEYKKVLEIGTGSGYQAAVLAEITDTVYTIEIVPELAKEAAERFRELGYTNIVARYGDGYKGWSEHAPFDIIIVTAAPDEIPQPLIDQLDEGGKMVIPVGGPYSIQDLILGEKKNGKFIKRKITSVRFVPFERLNN